MPKIIDISGVEYEIDCIACAIQKREVKLPVERIAETSHFVLEQDLEYPIEGFCILASKRHIHSISEFTKEEEEDFIALLLSARRAMKDILGIEDVTLVQEESTSSSHFHMWLFPWLPWMDGYKKKIGNISEIMAFATAEHRTPEYLDKVQKASSLLQKSFA